ncbi:AraC family transcriptional regulator [Methanosphaera sp. ISO3-F5]|uniref:helix-turn-helix transcriptional regulator n=1 Tax=Methanosphaera sp. ISO3-F5 TaxID=1452353 RepID=UPI002B260FBB|nr:AraC family transcriptional regulator [Methanosphaera sp. ISO3-F5]WQH63597.1 AraC family transcriptional regulator [Methanosphaera sp. ISO3-F5]
MEENIKRSYYKLKVLELLLFISNSDIKSITDKFPTLKVENVKKIKEIRNYLICNIDENITLDDLSLKYNISKTTIKTYFKTIYGKALITWRREYRLNMASILLKNNDLTVADVSHHVGYMDESKFIKSFKKYYGLTPNQLHTITHSQNHKTTNNNKNKTKQKKNTLFFINKPNHTL